jgi:hypothetical protein
MGGPYGTYGEKRMHTRFWWENLRTRTTEDSRHKWEDNIKMDLKEIRCGVDWIHPVQYTN